MSIEQFKENLVIPLKRTIEQHKAPTLSQFLSRDDLTKQWDRAEGMVMTLNHIESTYAAMQNANNPETAQNVEVLPPQN